ncbi:glycine betaine ABC transporter substrate-binding protein, partial [Hydrocoleum sp. CS-953]|uniref:glycine betaine ABC transporter substrate-binding protein n=1 Tax=Hydrocoleum sp. CS-953 TaxID=1671698 RepID=UPI0027392059
SLNGKNLGLPVDNVRILANKKFVETNPIAQRFFEQIEIPLDDVNLQQEKVKNGENKPIDIRHHAEEWVASHQGLFDSWLKVAIAIN